MTDPFDLERFVRAQDPVFRAVREELARGRKQSHWMWFVFPQIAGLGFSAMMANSPADILVELEQAVETCPLDRCGRILAGIVQLLTGSCDRSQEVLAHVVDGVLLRLTERVEARALAELSTTLAELKVAPPETLRRLAAHNDPDVA